VKLIIAIIEDDFVGKVIKSLTENEYRATRLSSSGGFLKSGNTTLLIGVEDDKVDAVVDIIREQCKDKKVAKGKEEVTVGGANIFILDVDGYNKL